MRHRRIVYLLKRPEEKNVRVEALLDYVSDAQVSNVDADVVGLAYDSRKVEPGYLFACLAGSRTSGQKYVEEALQRGATCILAESPVQAGDVCTIVVPNARGALAQIARRFYGNPSAQLTTVGITGTNGKTTVAHLVAGILEATGLPTGIVGTLGMRYGKTQWPSSLTTPESVDLLSGLAAMYQKGARAAVMEVSSHALAQERASGVDFNVGVFTNLSQDHLDYHENLESYFQTKARLLEERLKPTGKAVLNMDDEWVRRLRDNNAVGYSMSGSKDAQVSLQNLRLDSEGMRVDVRYGDEPICVRSTLLGRVNAENILAATAVGFALGIDSPAVLRGIANVAGVPGRLERVSRPGEPMVFVDYAHTPDALSKALDAVAELATGRVICVFGCGGERDKDKRLPMGEVVGSKADFAVLTNDNPRNEDPEEIARTMQGGLKKAGLKPTENSSEKGYQVEFDRARAIALAVQAAGSDDAVLIAGKGHEDYQLVGSERRAFDDREHARKQLDARGSGSGHKGMHA